MFDPDAPPRHPQLASALGPVRKLLRAAWEAGAGRKLMLACSGGRDSMAGLALLALLRRSEAFELSVAHVDHDLREGSAAEGEAVAAFAQGLQVPCLRGRLELERGAGLPARARAQRYRQLEQLRTRAGAEVIVLAHTATDQAETMLMHLARGASLEGLAAMRAWDPPLLRPLLELTRAQTGSLCALLELPFVDDPGNLDTRAPRVWWREQVFPRLRSDHPNFELAMLGLARDAGDAELALSTWAGRELHARRRAGEGASWTLEGYDALPRAVRTRLLRAMCEHCGVDLSRLRRREIEAMDAAALSVCTPPRSGPRGWDLHPRCRVQIDKHGFHAVESPV